MWSGAPREGRVQLTGWSSPDKQRTFQMNCHWLAEETDRIWKAQRVRFDSVLQTMLMFFDLVCLLESFSDCTWFSPVSPCPWLVSPVFSYFLVKIVSVILCLVSGCRLIWPVWVLRILFGFYIFYYYYFLGFSAISCSFHVQQKKRLFWMSVTILHLGQPVYATVTMLSTTLWRD